MKSLARPLVLLLSLVHCGASTRDDLDAIGQASDLLASVGVTDFCHPERSLPGAPLCNSAPRRLHEENASKRSTWHYVGNSLGALLCVLVAALASGLTIGLLSLDPLLLLIKSRASNTDKEKQQAASLLPIIKQHHLLLVTLLLLNTAAGEALPMFLHGLVPEIVAVLFSVVLVLFFGEILPSALFTGGNQMHIAATLAPVVKKLMCLLYPVAYPIARLLDCVIQEEPESCSVYNRSELAALIRIQYEERMAAKRRRQQALREEGISALQSYEDSDGEEESPVVNTSIRDLRKTLLRRGSSIHLDEVTMVEGALQMKTKCAVDLLLSYRKVFSISIDTILDEKNIVKIFSSGYSRVPVYEDDCKSRIKGILMTRQLIVVNSSDCCPVSRLPLHVPQCVGPDTNLVELVNLFQSGGSAKRVGHMALVCARPDIGNQALEEDEAVPEEAGVMGIITLEDVLEALLQEQIEDEMDAAGRVRAPTEMEADDSNSYHLA